MVGRRSFPSGYRPIFRWFVSDIPSSWHMIPSKTRPGWLRTLVEVNGGIPWFFGVVRFSCAAGITEDTGWFLNAILPMVHYGFMDGCWLIVFFIHTLNSPVRTKTSPQDISVSKIGDQLPMRPSMTRSIDAKYDHILGPLRHQFCAIVVWPSYIPSSQLIEFYPKKNMKDTPELTSPSSPGSRNSFIKLLVKYPGYVVKWYPAEVVIAFGWTFLPSIFKGQLSLTRFEKNHRIGFLKLIKLEVSR